VDRAYAKLHLSAWFFLPTTIKRKSAFLDATDTASLRLLEKSS